MRFVRLLRGTACLRFTELASEISVWESAAGPGSEFVRRQRDFEISFVHSTSALVEEDPGVLDAARMRLGSARRDISRRVGEFGVWLGAVSKQVSETDADVFTRHKSQIVMALDNA